MSANTLGHQNQDQFASKEFFAWIMSGVMLDIPAAGTAAAIVSAIWYAATETPSIESKGIYFSVAAMSAAYFLVDRPRQQRDRAEHAQELREAAARPAYHT